ncbi:SH3-like domain-containing protein [Ancylobacter lacus]|uniref:SH3-like domain-containing protein n=1 Tax=Ancylobacter lacus TaxID=2579970 RepID=UPI001BCCFA7A|nr:SH3-like domain-containing protein [Ancylobacter lacus]MBS7537798.1 nitrile hydratase subunit beta [Ancylobacter lacus]
MSFGPEEIVALVHQGATTRVAAPDAPPRFAPGDRVLTRNLNPPTHTRLPRYCRGKRGEVVRVHGVYAYPDARALGDDAAREYCYAVRFTARELWGDGAAAGDTLTIDMHDSYLLPDPAA